LRGLTRALGSRVSGGLSDLIQPTTGARRFLSGQLAGTYEEIVHNPDYRAQSGFLYLVHTDIQRVLDLIATPERPLIIFVDDLDRCSPGTVVQVIEAINIFVAGAYPNSIFVIAMEPEMVAAHIEAVYTDLAQKLETSGRPAQAPGLGWRFLEKIVQLPLALPAMEPTTTTAFFESLFPTQTTPTLVPSAAPADSNPSAVEETLRTASLSEAVGIAGDVPPDTAIKRELRRVIERRLTADDPEMQAVIGYASKCLRRNPREIKRFVNLFRFYIMIYTERKLAKLPAPASLHEVAKLAVLGIRWPSLLSTLALPAGDDERTIYELLESHPNSGDAESADAALEAQLKAAGLSETMTASLMTSEVIYFLRSEPKVGSGVWGYL
jgi:KAP family P-loop domain